MKTLENYTVIPALYRSPDGIVEAQVGDQVKIYLDQTAQPGYPEFILGVIQQPIVPSCDGTTYSIEYNEADIGGDTLDDVDIVSVTVVSCCDVLSDALAAAIASSLSLGSFVPVQGQYASLIVGIGGGFGESDYAVEANSCGDSGNDIEYSHTEIVGPDIPSVTITGNIFEVVSGTICQCIINGNDMTFTDGNPVVGSGLILRRNGTSWIANDTGPFQLRILTKIAGVWSLSIAYDTSSGVWTSTSSETDPSLIPAGEWNAITNPDAWKPYGLNTGTPAIAVFGASINQIVDLVNSSPDNSLITLVYSGGMPFNLALPITSTNLAGGADGTASPPYLSVSNDMLYVNQGGTWLEVAMAEVSIPN